MTDKEVKMFKMINDLRSQLKAKEARIRELEKFVEGISTASPGKWEMSRDDFESEFLIWARNVAKHLKTKKENK